MTGDLKKKRRRNIETQTHEKRIQCDDGEGD